LSTKPVGVRTEYEGGRKGKRERVPGLPNPSWVKGKRVGVTVKPNVPPRNPPPKRTPETPTSPDPESSRVRGLLRDSGILTMLRPIGA